MHDSVQDELVLTASTDDTNNLCHSELTAYAGNKLRASEESQSSGSSSGAASMDTESICLIQSPEHKRQRSSGKKKPLHESILRHLDNQQFSQLQSTTELAVHRSDDTADNPTSNPSPPNTPTQNGNIDEDLLTPRGSPIPPPVTTDPESQYTEKSFPPAGTEKPTQKGNRSPCRGPGP